MAFRILLSGRVKNLEGTSVLPSAGQSREMPRALLEVR